LNTELPGCHEDGVRPQELNTAAGIQYGDAKHPKRPSEKSAGHKPPSLVGIARAVLSEGAPAAKHRGKIEARRDRERRVRIVNSLPRPEMGSAGMRMRAFLDAATTHATYTA
jgi:hypothetical protein